MEPQIDPYEFLRERAIKVADEIVDLYQLELTEKDLKRLAINPDFQDSVRGFMSEVNSEGF